MSEEKPDEVETEPDLARISFAFSFLNSPNNIDTVLDIDCNKEGEELNILLANYKNAIELVILGLEHLAELLSSDEPLQHAVDNINAVLRMQSGTTRSLKRLSPEERAEKISVDKVKTYFCLARELFDIYLIPDDARGSMTVAEYFMHLQKNFTGHMKIKSESLEKDIKLINFNTDSKLVRIAILEILINALKYGKKDINGCLIIDIERSPSHYQISNYINPANTPVFTKGIGLNILKRVFGKKMKSDVIDGIYVTEIYIGTSSPVEP